MQNKFSLFIQPLAEEDLEMIYDHTVQKWSEKQALIYQDALFDYMDVICINPTIGNVYPFGHLEFRKLTANKHIIFYRIKNQQIIVVRTLHGRMNYNEHL